MVTRTATKGSTANIGVTIPNPDLLDLVRKYLPGEAGISVMYSIAGAMSFRAARLAGMVANGLASDVRNHERTRDSISSYNDAMSYLDEQGAAEVWFDEAGGQRLDMCKQLSSLLHYKRTCDDYMASLMGESKMRVTNWMETLEMAGEPMPVDGWKLDFMWKEYVDQCGGEDKTEISRSEYDMLNTRELSGTRALWAKHIATVLQVIAVADKGDSIQFMQLDKITQLSLLMSYATPERMQKFRTSIMKRARSAFQAEADIRLHKGFVEACRLASTHHRYANEGDKLVPRVEPTGKPAPSLRKDTSPVGTYIAQVAASVDAEAKIDAKAAKPKKAKAKAASPRKVVPQTELKAELSLADQPNDPLL